jgi:putative membrane protein
MIIRFSSNLLEQSLSIIRNNFSAIIFFISWSTLIYLGHDILNVPGLDIPMEPVALLGGGLAFFLAFRNNSAYDRWWEARKIWGGIVNTCRIFGAFVASFKFSDQAQIDWKKALIYRHLAWINSIRIQLRKLEDWSDVKRLISKEEFKSIENSVNVATQLGAIQSKKLLEAKSKEWIDGFDHQILLAYLEELYALQGKAERIRNTVFPYFYQLFTRFFLWLFILLLPFGLVGIMEWQCIPVTVFTSFVFYILEKTANITDQPLHPRSSGTPMNQICRVIEIDMLQQLGETEVPEVYKPKETRHGSLYLD